MVEIRNLTKIYKSKKKEKCVALDDVSFSLDKKGFVFSFDCSFGFRLHCDTEGNGKYRKGEWSLAKLLRTRGNAKEREGL